MCCHRRTPIPRPHVRDPPRAAMRFYQSLHQRLSVNTHMKDSLINTLEDVARDVRMGLQTTGIEKLQTIMTEAKEKVSPSWRRAFRKPGISLDLCTTHYNLISRLPALFRQRMENRSMRVSEILTTPCAENSQSSRSKVIFLLVLIRCVVGASLHLSVCV